MLFVEVFRGPYITGKVVFKCLDSKGPAAISLGCGQSNYKLLSLKCGLIAFFVVKSYTVEIKGQ